MLLKHQGHPQGCPFFCVVTKNGPIKLYLVWFLQECRMKKLGWLWLGVCVLWGGCSTDADEGFDAASVCPSEGTNIYGMPNRGTFVDERDGQEYQYTTIGDQVWMAQSLNYDYPEAVCYDSLSENCEKFGRLYLGKDVSNLCPAEWRLPVEEDIEVLLKSIDNKHEVLLAGYWYNTDSTKINECGMSIYSAGESHFSEDMYMGRRVSFWLADIQESIQNRSYFYEDGFKISIYSTYSETPRKYIRCIKD